MTVTLTINVTQQHIDRAIELLGAEPQRICSICPVALAATDAAGTRASASENWVTVYREDHDEVYRSAPTVAAFVRAFDDRQPVHPFSFVATLYDPAHSSTS